MSTAIRALIGLVGVFNLLLGLGFLLMPKKLAKDFCLSPVGVAGLASLRADFPGFFIGASVFALLGAAWSRADLLLVPLLLLAIAFCGRVLSLVLDGATSKSYLPMAAELVMIAVLFTGYRVLGG